MRLVAVAAASEQHCTFLHLTLPSKLATADKGAVGMLVLGFGGAQRVLQSMSRLVDKAVIVVQLMRAQNHELDAIARTGQRVDSCCGRTPSTSYHRVSSEREGKFIHEPVIGADADHTQR